MRARGLKQAPLQETVLENRSRPMRARGLKPEIPIGVEMKAESRPMRARGLKPKEFPDVKFMLSRAPCGRVD